MSAGIRVLPTLGRKLWKQMRRFRDIYENSASLDVHNLEASMTHGLFIKTAEELGLSYRRVGPMLCIEDAEGAVFRLVANGTDVDPLPICELCGDKVATRELLEAAGLSIPRGRAFRASEVDQAVGYARDLGTPCVVKPADGTAAETGVTIHIAGSTAVHSAFQRAALYTNRVLVEEWVPGDDYRFLVYRGTCLSVVRRYNPKIVGNGRDSINTLVACENANRIRNNEWHLGDPIWMPIVIRRNGSDRLAPQGFTPFSKPAEGKEVVVSKTTYRFGGTHEEVMQHCHPAVLRVAECAAAALSVQLAGVDILSEDIRQSGYRIIEVNTTPALWFHYFISNPEMCRDPIQTILRDRLRASGLPGASETAANRLSRV